MESSRACAPPTVRLSPAIFSVSGDDSFGFQARLCQNVCRCLQFSAQLGKVEDNIARANALLQDSSISDFDLLILPELAFTGYNFLSLAAITPYLESTASGISFQWAKTTAARLQCIVTVGYPELASRPPLAAPPTTAVSSGLICYNSTVTVSSTGLVLAHYRKTHLYYTDETWAQGSPTGWHTTSLPLPRPSDSTITTFGICMDLNPCRFTAPWSLYEFSNHAISLHSQLLLLSMAWLTDIPSSSLIAEAAEPDMGTLAYWCSRLQPLIDHEEEVVVVIANRSGEEEPHARYAGTSWIGRIGRGKIQAWGVLRRGEESVLVADTEKEPVWKLTMRQQEEDD